MITSMTLRSNILHYISIQLQICTNSMRHRNLLIMFTINIQHPWTSETFTRVVSLFVRSMPNQKKNDERDVLSLLRFAANQKSTWSHRHSNHHALIPGLIRSRCVVGVACDDQQFY